MHNSPVPPPREERIRIYRDALAEEIQLRRPQLRASLQVSLAQELLDDRSRSRAESLEEAIAALREAVRIYRQERLPIPWAESCASLAVAFLERIRGGRQDNLKEALRSCRRALQVQGRRSRRAAWAEVVDCLASGLAARNRAPRAAYLEKSIDLFRRVLPIRKAATDPSGWVSTSIHLARALNERILGDRAQDIEEAIVLLQRAEKALLGQESTSPQWAVVQNNLAVMYRERLRGDPTANRVQAIEILSTLLEQPGLAMIDRGRALHLLAALHVEQTRDRRAQSLERAILLYQRALEVHTLEDLPGRWMETSQNLATAYAERLEGDPAENLERAISLYRQVLDQIDPRQAPEDWATTASNPATAYSDRQREDRRLALLDSVTLHRQVLEVRRERDPRGWALTSMNLGNTFARLDLVSEPGAFEAAVEAYRQALAVHQIATLPGEHRRTQGNLADLYFARQRWQEALDAYFAALSAGDVVYQSAATPVARRAALRPGLDFSLRASWCLVHLGRTFDAIVLLEKTRTRSLNEALGQSEAMSQRIPAPLRSRLLTTRERIANLEATSHRLEPAEREAFLRLTKELRRHRTVLVKTLADIRTAVPDSLPEDMNVATAVAVATQAGAPLVHLLTTTHGSVGLLASPSGEIASLFLDRFKEGHLRDILQGAGEEASYLRLVAGEDALSLQRGLDRCGALLQELLIAPLAEQILQRGFRRACLIACGSLALLPLAALAPEDFVFHLSPSVRALESVQIRRREETPPRLLAVGDPPSLHSLAFAAFEMEEIATLFPADRRQVLAGREASLIRVRQELRGATHLHFTCHGSFRFDEPLLSSLSLAGGEALCLRDLFDPGLDLASLRLVVLSACQTGISDQELPDEALGFPAAFLQAGVPAVVSTLWPVNDEPTALLLIRFYQDYLVERLDPALALRLAQTWLRTSTVRELRLVEHCERIMKESRRPEPAVYQRLRRYRQNPEFIPFQHPYFWAGFIATGSGHPGR